MCERSKADFPEGEVAGIPVRGDEVGALRCCRWQGVEIPNEVNL